MTTQATDLEERYYQFLLDLKFRIQSVIRDKGITIGFGTWGKRNWMKYDENVALVSGDGEVVWCWIIPGHRPKPNLQPGKDPSIFDPEKGIRPDLLLRWLSQFPGNP